MDLSSRVFRFLFPSVLFETDSQSVHLTFDDGPHPVATPTVLDMLRDFGIRATFFLTGSRVREYPKLAERLGAEGHVVGNHAFRHTSLLFQSRQGIRENILRCQEAIQSATGLQPALFRPPFGYYDYRALRIARELNLQLVHWSCDSRDFRSAGHAMAAQRVVDRVNKGSIILLHDNEATTKTVATFIPSLIRGLQARGFTFSVLT